MTKVLGKNVLYEPDLEKLYDTAINKKCKNCNNFSRYVVNDLCEVCRKLKSFLS